MDETRMILEMLKDGKLTVEQAERLLGAVGRPEGTGSEGAGGSERGEDFANWSARWRWDRSGCGSGGGAWSWVGDLGCQIGEEVHRATSQARAAVEQAMAEARRAGEEARRAGEEARRAGRQARAHVIRIFQESSRDSE